MKMTAMKKKVLISSLALAMVTTSTLFRIPRVYGEDKASVGEKEKPKEEAKTTAGKAFLTEAGAVTGRKSDNTSDDKAITDFKTITDLMIGDKVVSVDAEKFRGLKNLTTLTFKEASNTEATKASKVKKIGANAFRGTGITSVELPKNLATIEEGAFADNTALTTVTFTHSKNISQIKTGAFENSGLTNVDLSPLNTGSQGILEVGANAFKGNKNLASVTLSTKMEDIGVRVFANTKIASIEIAEKVVSVSPFAFQETPLQTLTVKSTNRNLSAENNILYNFNKTSLLLYPEGKTEAEFTIPDSVTAISANAFSSAPSLTKVVVNVALTDIGQYAFANAKTLTTLDLRKASAINIVEEKAFSGSALASMIIGQNTGPLETVELGAFDSTAPTRTISFLDDTNAAIEGVDIIALAKKYKALKEPAQGGWKFDAKLATPTAIVDYDNMQLKDLEPSAVYSIQGSEYTADAQGKIDLLKEWSGISISIVRKSAFELNDSDAQTLAVDKLYGLTIDGKESLKKAGVNVTVQAERKEGYKFNGWSAKGITLTDASKEKVTFVMPENDVQLEIKYTNIITTNPADMIYDGTKEVIIRIDIPLNEFQYIEYNGQKLTRDVDYIVSSGSTIITFTKTFLDNMQGDMTGIKAVFTSNSATFTIKRMLPVTPANPTKVEAVKVNTKQPNTGDSTNIYVLCMMLLGSIGTVLLVKKRNKQS